MQPVYRLTYTAVWYMFDICMRYVWYMRVCVNRWNTKSKTGTASFGKRTRVVKLIDGENAVTVGTNIIQSSTAVSDLEVLAASFWVEHEEEYKQGDVKGPLSTHQLRWIRHLIGQNLTTQTSLFKPYSSNIKTQTSLLKPYNSNLTVQTSQLSQFTRVFTVAIRLRQYVTWLAGPMKSTTAQFQYKTPLIAS